LTTPVVPRQPTDKEIVEDIASEGDDAESDLSFAEEPGAESQLSEFVVPPPADDPGVPQHAQKKATAEVMPPTPKTAHKRLESSNGPVPRLRLQNLSNSTQQNETPRSFTPRPPLSSASQ